MQPNFGMPVVDVTNVAALHVTALVTPESIGKRVVASDRGWTLPEMAGLLAREYPACKIAMRNAPRWLLKVLSVFNP